ncbi:hypothetical protein jhhlp_005437 [Lomentospora prolificans]|uniref:Uncharacterized protein n=1 Tax=Lomentospora prolificans TaxID=41688 RepID=A0A2N3N6V3_9PEZI|nr:hypothetical protein jhhlp_005437 [Lomentospora prolificans]
MIGISTLTWSIALLLGGLAPRAASALECRPEGPIFPKPDLTKSSTFDTAINRLQELLDSAIAGEINAGWDVPNTTLSIAFVAKGQRAPGEPLWEYHHLAENTELGTRNLNRDAQYQIGSISKLITDAVLIRSNLNLDDPITRYLPGLGGSPSLIPWDTITLRALASNLAGIPPNFGYSEYYYLKDTFLELGLPPLNNSEYLMCDVFGLNLGCAKSQYIVGLKGAHPVSPPMQRPVYSNVAFTLLMYAVGAATDSTYTQVLYEFITGPLGMVNTYASPGLLNSSVVPPVNNSYGFWFGDATPGGGLVSSLSDLTSFVYHILTYTIFDSPMAVRQWLQPRSFAGSRHSFFGMPWEIYRPPPEAVFPDYEPETQTGGHTFSIFTKDGAAYGYRARASVIDEYGVGLVILAAGDSSAVTIVNDAMIATLIPSIHQASREQTEELGYVGSFTGCSEVAFSATISIDESSLILDLMSYNGSDMMHALREIFSMTYQNLIPNYEPGPILRLYPTEVEIEDETDDRNVVIREDWRFVWDIKRERTSELPGQTVSSYDCLAWEAVDWIYYGSEAVDRVVFVKDPRTNEVLWLEIPFLRAQGSRGDDCADGEEPEIGEGRATGESDTEDINSEDGSSEEQSDQGVKVVGPDR